MIYNEGAEVGDKSNFDYTSNKMDLKYKQLNLYQDTFLWIEDTSINRTLFFTYVTMTISEMGTPHYLGHFNLV